MNIQQVITEMGYQPTTYSGRYMFGAECVGVVVEDYNQFAYELGVYAREHQMLEDLADYVANWRIDQLGKRYIIYWPGIQLWTDESLELPADGD